MDGSAASERDRLPVSLVVGAWLHASLAFPALVVDHAAKRQAIGPAASLELWLVQELLRVADAEIGDGYHGLGNTEDRPELVIVEDADPAHTDALHARGEPEVLNRAAGAEEVGVDDGVSSEHVGPAARPIAGDADVDRRVLDSLELQRSVERGAWALIIGGGGLVSF